MADSERFLAQHSFLAGRAGGDHLRGVNRVGAAHRDNVDVRILQDRVRVCGGACPTAFGDSLGDSRVDVHHADDVEAVRQIRQRWKMNRLRHKTRAEEPDSE